MKKMIVLTIPLLFVLIGFHSSDNFVVYGKVLSDAGKPIAFATVIEKNTNNGTMTDSAGNFTITVRSEKSVLVVSAVGYSSTELKVNGQQTINIALAEA